MIAVHFETRTRDNEQEFVTLRDDAPEWLRAAVRDAHQGDLPSDWIYEECRAACRAIDEGSLTEDDTHPHVDGRVDTYTKDLFAWAAEMCLTSTFSEADGRASETSGAIESIPARLAAIQYFAIEYIASVMLNAAKANEEEG